jgi:hypothetical protein
MPYKGKTYVGEEMITEGLKRAPAGPGFTIDQLNNAVCMEITHSSFTDPGEDWDQYDLIDSRNKSIASIRLKGY